MHESSWPSHKHGRRHKTVPTVDIGALVIVLLVAVWLPVGRQDLAVPRIVPASGGGREVMLPPILTIAIIIFNIVMEIIQVLQQQGNSKQVTPHQWA